MGRECIITAMPAEVHYDGGSLPFASDEKRALSQAPTPHDGSDYVSAKIKRITS